MVSSSIVSIILLTFVFGFIAGSVVVGSVDDKVRKDEVEELREEIKRLKRRDMG